MRFFWILFDFFLRSLSMLLATSYAAPDVRKVPPRTPPQRLDTLQRFTHEYIDAYVDPYRSGRTDNQKKAVDRIFNRLYDNYVKFDETTGLRLCSFFDPTTEHGGPRPDNTGKRALKDLWVQKELCALGKFWILLKMAILAENDHIAWNWPFLLKMDILAENDHLS